MDIEVDLDKYLKIKTNGRDDSKSNYINFPYEATPYLVLESLANSGFLSKRDVIIDYGAGKGRVDFYLSYFAKATMIGIEYDERLYEAALRNLSDFKVKSRVSFFNDNAKSFKPNDNVTGAYFFNPFCVDILNECINNLGQLKRNIKLFFYYPSKEYIEYLEKRDDISYIDEIDLKYLYNNGDLRECIKIYELKNEGIICLDK